MNGQSQIDRAEDAGCVVNGNNCLKQNGDAAGNFGHSQFPPSTIVGTKSGQVQGFRIELSTGKTADIFLGIPYAKPPIGELRFERPVSAEPWHGILQATKFGPASVPTNFFDLEDDPNWSMSEDSLILNLIRPSIDCQSEPSESDPFPTFVYVHGGGFCSGSARDYGYEQLAENFATRGIIVVVIQYRLGPFGFLTLGDGTSMPGNLGYWDQAFAFKYLSQNIAAFGGDPRKITAVGLSAGGASVASLALSPHSRDYICANVEMSGTVLPEWSASERSVEASVEFIECLLGEHIELSSMDLAETEKLKQRLKEAPFDEFKRAIKIVGTSRYDLNLLKYEPRIDGEFFPKDFPALLRELPENKPALMGITANEAIYLAIQSKDPFLNEFGIDRLAMESFDEATFRHFVSDCIVGGRLAKFLKRKGPKLVAEAEREICDFYLEPECKNGPRDSKFHLAKYSKLLSDLLFNVPVCWVAELRRQFKRPTYLYFNEYFNEKQFENWVPVRASTHSNEYPYMNGIFPVGEFEFTESDHLHRRIIVEMISSFVKDGVPTLPEDLRFDEDWPPNSCSDGETPLKFMRIDANNRCTVVELKDLEKSVDFWTRFNRKYSFNLIRGIPNK